HPGFDLELLNRVAQLNPGLAKVVKGSLERSQDRPRKPNSGKGSTDWAPAVAKLDLSPSVFAWAFAQPESRLARRIFSEVERVAREVGYNNGTLAPRDVASADSTTRLVLANLYLARGKKTMPLELIRDALPAALAKVARRSKSGDALRIEAAIDLV